MRYDDCMYAFEEIKQKLLLYQSIILVTYEAPGPSGQNTYYGVYCGETIIENGELRISIDRGNRDGTYNINPKKAVFKIIEQSTIADLLNKFSGIRVPEGQPRELII